MSLAMMIRDMSVFTLGDIVTGAFRKVHTAPVFLSFASGARRG